ncbi:MAG: hypothetical protein ACI9HB_000553 [Gammaproteobacteria bacterium]|jgi:hypothetical protein
MTNPRVVLVNDTDVDGHHFGCARVMSVIRSNLQARGITPAGSVQVALNWRDNHADLIGSADILVIDGEGTLHHGSRKGRWLLEAAQSVKARGGKTALINALWQDNPDDWTNLVKDIDILACRDSRSADLLSTSTGRKVRLMGDLSMAGEMLGTTAPRSGIVFGDSVHANVTKLLASKAAAQPDAVLVPVTSSLKFISPSLHGLRRTARRIYAKHRQNQFLAQNPSAKFVSTQAEYVGLIAQKALSVTGRFHAVCLAIATQTPFVAISSNSWKIEALLDDIGLNPERVVPQESLTDCDLSPENWAFSAQESINIETQLNRWQQDFKTLFDDIADLTKVK